MGSARAESRDAVAARVLADLDAFFAGRDPPDAVA
jgi:hypothetical protein